jgi:hypothetical protein
MPSSDRSWQFWVAYGAPDTKLSQYGHKDCAEGLRRRGAAGLIISCNPYPYQLLL